MKILKIGKENSTFQEILALKENRTKRAQCKKFFVEGVQNIKDAVANNWLIDSFIFTNYEKLSNWAKDLLSKNLAQNNYELSNDLMEKLSDKENKSEILAIIKMKEQDLFIKNECPLILLFDRPSKKGNLGTIIRSADALGVDQILYTGHAVDIYDHTVITTTMGSFFKVPYKFIESNAVLENYIEEMKKRYKDFQVVGSSLQTENSIKDIDFTKPTLLLIGNEAMGISHFLREKCDEFAKIPMRPNIDSLNVACATSIFLYEAFCQRN